MAPKLQFNYSMIGQTKMTKREMKIYPKLIEVTK